MREEETLYEYHSRLFLTTNLDKRHSFVLYFFIALSALAISPEILNKETIYIDLMSFKCIAFSLFSSFLISRIAILPVYSKKIEYKTAFEWFIVLVFSGLITATLITFNQIPISSNSYLFVFSNMTLVAPLFLSINYIVNMYILTEECTNDIK